MILTTTKCIAIANPPDVEEAMTTCYGLELTNELNLPQLALEMECKTVITALSAEIPLSNEVGLICEDIKCLPYGFGTFSFHQVSRSCNDVAHLLNRLAIGFNPKIGLLYESSSALTMDLIS